MRSEADQVFGLGQLIAFNLFSSFQPGVAFDATPGFGYFESERLGGRQRKSFGGKRGCRVGIGVVDFAQWRGKESEGRSLLLDNPPDKTMPVLISLAALQRSEVRVVGSLPPLEHELDTLDPCVKASGNLAYSASCQLMGPEMLVEGVLELGLECECVRCLTKFEHVLRVDPWACLLPLEGEDAAPRIDDSVDLTPQMREDSLLALPQHPVCSPECRGVPLENMASSASGGVSSETEEAQKASSAWSALDALKLD